MTSKRIAQSDRQQKSDKPQESGILQRAAVRSVSDAGMQSTDDKEALTLSNSVFSKDFSRVPISTTKPQQFQPRNSQSHLMPPIQAKLTIGEPGDRYEQEADRVASEVVQRINAPASAGQSVQRRELQAPLIRTLESQPGGFGEIKLKPLVQRQDDPGGGEAKKELESSINRARGGGQPLDASLQRSMGQAMGADFSGVRVHTDSQSNQLNQSIQAKAFTTGQDVFFRQGEYHPGSRGGQELLAHELTHVVQQSGGTVAQGRKEIIQPYWLYPKAVSQENIIDIKTATRQIQRADNPESSVGKIESARQKYPRAGVLLEGITDDMSDQNKVNKLIENIVNRNFKYTGRTRGVFNGEGDCGTLVSEVHVLAKAILDEPDTISGKTSEGQPFFIKNGGAIIGDSKSGNVDNGKHWIFSEHQWIEYNGEVIDVLFKGHRGEKGVVGEKTESTTYKFGEEYYCKAPTEDNPLTMFCQVATPAQGQSSTPAQGQPVTPARRSRERAIADKGCCTIL